MKTKATAQKRTKVTKKTSAPFAPLFPSFPFVKILFALLSAASFSCTLHAQAPQYTITELGTLGGSSSYAYSINNSGQVTGISYTTEDSRAFLFSGGTMSDLGTLGGSYSEGYGINDSGQITGYSHTTNNDANHAFLYSDDTMSDIGTLGGDTSFGFSINNAGQVTGWSPNANYKTHAFLYSGGNMSDLGSLGGTNSDGFGINNAGQVTGGSDTTDNSAYHAFLYSSGSMSDLGTLGGSASTGFGINNAGEVTGRSQTTDNIAYHAFLYSGGTMNDLGTLGGSSSRGSGVNDSGQVIGSSHITDDIASHGFLYSGNTMYDLNDLVGATPLATNIQISDYGNPINNWGQIAAAGAVNGSMRALILNPVDPLTTLSDGGTTQNIKFIAGVSYSKFAIITNPGNLHTTAALLGGTAGSGGASDSGLNRDVTITFSAGTEGLASDIVSLHGTESDIFVLELSMTSVAPGSYLGWLNGNNQWVNAAIGNTGNTANPLLQTNYEGSFADFQTAFGTTLTNYIGAWGFTNTSVWAVLNHNSDFGVVPEPSTCALLLLSTSALLLRRKRITLRKDRQETTSNEESTPRVIRA